MTTDEYEQALSDARAEVEADLLGRALDAGEVTYSDYSPEEAQRVLDSLPPADLELTTVTTSVRLPFPLHQRLRAYAAEHGTTATALIKDWVEQMLAVPDRPISLADAVRVLSGLPVTRRDAA